MSSTVDIGKDVGSKILNGHTVVGTTRAKLVAVKLLSLKGVVIRAATGNTNDIWIGGESVTADSVVGTGGMPIVPGASLTIPIEDPSELWVISDAVTQDVAWLILS